MKNADMPAMPVLNGDNEPADMDLAYYMNSNLATGLTKREMMAMHMMGALVSGGHLRARDAANLSTLAVALADDLLGELGRTK